ncbi:MAG: hypothetical protein Kow0029_28760 [Candidatus Rifleibacteriota bacterium]
MSDNSIDTKESATVPESPVGSSKPGSSIFSSIKFKAWLGVLLLTVIPILSVGFYSFNVLSDISRSILIESNIQAFQQVKYEVDQYVAMYEDLAKFLANDVRLDQPASLEAWQALQQLDQSYEYVERIVLCDSQGNLLRHSKPDQNTITELSVPEKLLARSQQKIMFSPEAFLVKAPISDDPDSNVIIATISFIKLRKSLEGITFGTNFRYFLVTQEGENLLDQPDFPQELISDLMQRPCGAYDVINEALPPQVAISLPVLHYNLRIFVFQNAGEVYAVASTIRNRTFYFVFLIGLLSLLLGTYLSIKLTAPVIAIADKANELSEGNLEAQVDIKRNDELGFLAACFNKMARRIRNKVFELSAMYRVSQIINSSSTYQQALDECLSHLIEIFHARRGSIMLLNDDRTKLSVESYRQTGDEHSGAKGSGKFELQVGEGIAGEVVATCRPILCMDCANDERFKNYDNRNDLKPPTTLVSVPLIVHGTSVGVVNLSDRSTSEPFNQEDLDLLQAIVGQMAMSIDNARLHELTITDSLTELYIQKYFHIRLEDEIKRARRFSFPLTLVIFDIDKFSLFNEKNGRKLGDAALWEIGQILKDSVRATDIPCRSGPEEFAVILAHTNAGQALVFAERLRERIAGFVIKRGDQEGKLTVSLGIAEYSNETVHAPHKLIEMAEEAVAESKKKGGNITTTFRKKSGGEA